MLNIGPTKDGVIVPIFQERLSNIGEWLKVNGEAIYSSRPWTYQNDTKTANIWLVNISSYIFKYIQISQLLKMHYRK